MDPIEAKILLKNLLDRVVTLEDGSKQLTGKLTSSELDALNFSVSMFDNKNLLQSGNIVTPSDQLITDASEKGKPVTEAETDKSGKSQSQSQSETKLDTSSLKLPAPSDDARICLDFGTAMSKATLVKDEMDGEFEDIHVLKLGIPGDQEEISETMLVSSVYIDNAGLLWFGQQAVVRSENESQDGIRRRLDNIKRWLSEEGFDETVNDLFNPTEIIITYGEMIQAYLMFLTWAVNHSLDDDGYPRNIIRRFAMPIFDGEKKHETLYRLRKMLGDAQILADTFHESLQNGIPLQVYKNAVMQLNGMKNNYLFIQEDITEPLGVAGSLLSWKTNINSLVMVVDVGAGTSDFSLFRIAYNPETKKSSSREVAGSAKGITEAGNYLDYLLIGYILNKSGITHENSLYKNILGALNLTIRDHKESLFRDGFVSVSLFNNDVVEIDKDEFLDLPQVKMFGDNLKDAMTDILESIDESWIKSAPPLTGTPTLTVALTGGGAELPMVKNLAKGEITIKGNNLSLVESMHFPKWLDDEGYDDLEDEYPRIAVSLGGARRNIIPHGNKAAFTAGDVKETAVLGGYYQKGN